VPGRVIEVPIKSNQSVRKGDVLFRIDPQPYRDKLSQAEATFRQTDVQTRAAIDQAEQSLRGAAAGTTAAEAAAEAAKANLAAMESSLQLAGKRLAQYGELASKGAGSKFAVEQAESDVSRLKEQVGAQQQQIAAASQQAAAARAQEGQARIAVSSAAQIRGTAMDQAKTARDSARWNLDQTVVTAPDDGYVPQLQLEPGAMAASAPVMTFVYSKRQTLVSATVVQQYVNVIKPGADAEVALAVLPGRTLKAKVIGIEMAVGTGQLAPTGVLRSVFQPNPAPRMYVILSVEDDLSGVNVPLGSSGYAAITGSGAKPLFVVRRVMIRIYTWTNYFLAGV
jgi:multidrug resistance efflux pump